MRDSDPRGRESNPLSKSPVRDLSVSSAQVIPGSPAAALRVGDIVVAVDGKPIPSATDMQRLMVEDAIGKPVEITIWRNGALVDVIAVPRELDSSA